MFTEFSNISQSKSLNFTSKLDRNQNLLSKLLHLLNISLNMFLSDSFKFLCCSKKLSKTFKINSKIF